MMPESKLDVSDKARKLVVFPEMLGILVIGGFCGREERSCNVKGIESGEELQTFEPHGFAMKQMIKDQCYDFDEEPSVHQNTYRNLGSIVQPCNDVDDEKRSDLEYELSQKEINLEKLQRVASSGIPDGGSLRATIWKLLLGYLPTSRDLWEKELTESGLKCVKLKEEILLNPSELSRRKDKSLRFLVHNTSSEVSESLERYNISKEDHPLSLVYRNFGADRPWFAANSSRFGVLLRRITAL